MFDDTNKQFMDGIDSWKSDLYSIGAIFIKFLCPIEELIFMPKLFSNFDDKTLLERLQKHLNDEDPVQSLLINLLSQMTKHEKENRISAQELAELINDSPVIQAMKEQN